jgi:hypothetical protein
MTSRLMAAGAVITVLGCLLPFASLEPGPAFAEVPGMRRSVNSLGSLDVPTGPQVLIAAIALLLLSATLLFEPRPRSRAYVAGAGVVTAGFVVMRGILLLSRINQEVFLSASHRATEFGYAVTRLMSVFTSQFLVASPGIGLFVVLAGAGLAAGASGVAWLETRLVLLPRPVEVRAKA